MTEILIGSEVMRKWFHDFKRTERKDVDIMTFEEVTPERKAELEEWYGVHVDIFTDQRLAQWEPWVEYEKLSLGNPFIANPDELYTMKISHAFWEINNDSRNWDKHAADIVFLERKGAKFLRELYDILLPIWKERYKRNVTNLNQSAGMFFADAVQRKYDHDSLHCSVAYTPGKPLYEEILQDGSDVMVDNDKFFKGMDHETQIKTVREEIYATALERILIPDDYTSSPRAAYHWALRRTATSLFKGEWALFLMLNLDELMVPDCNYMQRHLDNAEQLIPLPVGN